jgi:hypothetical protein
MVFQIAAKPLVSNCAASRWYLVARPNRCLVIARPMPRQGAHFSCCHRLRQIGTHDRRSGIPFARSLSDLG